MKSIVFLIIFGLLFGPSLYAQDAKKSLFDRGVEPIIKQEKLATPLTIRPYVQDKPMKVMATSADLKACVGLVDVGGRFYGTGVVVNYGESQYVVTCNHVLRDVIPKDKLKYNDKELVIAGLDKVNDVGVALCAELSSPGVSISGTEVKVGDKLKSVGSNGKLGKDFLITEMNHTVESLDDGVIYTDGPVIKGRSGGGLFDKDDKLVGIFCGVNETIHRQVYTKVSKLIPLFDLKQYAITFYSGATCKFCKEQSAITDATNDRRIIADWTFDKCPDWILKKLPKGYLLPVAVWKCKGNKYSWPVHSGVNTISQLVAMCEASNAVVVQETTLSMESKGPVGAINARAHIEQLISWYTKYLPNGAVGSMVLVRSGVNNINLYGGKKTPVSLENILGKVGSFEFEIIYPDGTPEADKLQIRRLAFKYNITDNDISFDLETITLHGIVNKINDKLVFSSGVTESPKGAIGFFTLWTILSTVHTIWVILHPVMDISLPNKISLTTGLRDGGIFIDFQDPVAIKILSLMSFNLPINQVLISVEKIVTKFSGTIFAKQYTLDVE